MIHREDELFALRSIGVRIAASAGRLAACAIALAICAGLQGCSSDPGWPTLGKISDLGNVMTPEERQKAIQDLQKNGQNQNNFVAAAAAKQDQ